MINWLKTKKGINAFKENHIMMMYGREDPSYRYIELLDYVENEKMTYKVVEGADHLFTNMEADLEMEIMDFLVSITEEDDKNLIQKGSN